MSNNNLFKTVPILIAFIAFNLVLSHISYSQDKIMPPPSTNFYSLSPFGSTNNPMLTTVQPNTDMPQAEQTLLSQIRDARRNGDVVRAGQLQHDLDNMFGLTPSSTNPISNSLPTPVSVISIKNSTPQSDYLISPINTGSDPWCVATCTTPAGAPNAGRIWAAYTGFNGSATDTFKLAYSDNGGATWTQYSTFNYSSSNVKFRSHELNIIPVYDGTNLSIWGVAGYTFNNNNFTALFRYNITLSTFYYVNFTPPGSGTTYNPRLTTDNSNYTSAAYVYVIASFDSTYGSNLHWTFQKYAVILNPTVATPTVTYRAPNASGGSFWWNSSGLSAGQYLSSDIGYYSDQGGTGADRIMTVYNLNNGGGSGTNSLYLAWTDDYGATHTGAISLTVTIPTRGARIAFNGGTANRNGMIVYLSAFGSSNDWDVDYQSTTNGGTLTSGWTHGNIDFTSFPRIRPAGCYGYQERG